MLISWLGQWTTASCDEKNFVICDLWQSNCCMPYICASVIYIMLHSSRYSVISCQRDQSVICDGWVEMRRRPFSPMCDAASSQLVVTTNDRPSIPICPIVHNTENIDRPLARDLTAKNILGRKKCPLTSINKYAPDRLPSLSVGCRYFSSRNLVGFIM